MNRDPLYDAILERLAGEIDGALFQDCAQALLQEAYPSLAVMHGGDDAGLDGAIGTSEGAYPLICTVSDRLPDNFRRNTLRNLEERKGPRKAVLATTTKVSNRQRRNLEAGARELGVQIVNIHDRLDFAARLYRDRTWRLKLLGLSGEPPSLSALPLRSRTGGTLKTGAALRGREDELRWLRTTPGDLLLVGQPGAGKTYLHQSLAAEGRCLFAIDQNLGRLADAVREQKPLAIVVDDVHIEANLELLESLSRLRIELDFQFTLHANCWPGAERRVVARMRLSDGQVRRLERLPRTTILELIQDADIVGPDELLHLLLAQADGKPGLARVLIDACKRHELGRVWTGEILADYLIEGRDLRLDEQDRCILAAFAMGGEHGHSMKAVASALQLTEMAVRASVTNLDAGGVIEEVTEDRLQVRPAALRPIIVRDVFFSGPRSIDHSPFWTSDLSPSEVAHVLMGVAQRGGNIQTTLLEDRVKHCIEPGVWEHFSWVSKATARLILDRYPKRVCMAAPGLLHHDPERTLPILLDVHAKRGVPMCNQSPSAESRVTEWVQGDDLDDRVTVERRRTLLGVLEHWMDTVNADPDTLAWGLKLVLYPGFDRTRLKPGNGRELVITRGHISADECASVQQLWPRVVLLLKRISRSSLGPILRVVQRWCHPDVLTTTSLGESANTLMSTAGIRMLFDLSTLPQANRALRSRIASIASWAHCDVQMKLDPVYELLYGDRHHGDDLEKQDAERSCAIRELAETYAGKTPNEAVTQLLDMEDDAKEMADSPTNRQWLLHGEISRILPDPFSWIDTLISKNAPASFVQPYIERATGFRPRLDVLLPQLFAMPEYRRLVAEIVLGLEQPANSLLTDVVDALPAIGNVYQMLERFRRLPASTMVRLLSHSERSIRVISAIAEWSVPPRGEVRPELLSAWREAIVLARNEDSYYWNNVSYRLGEILKVDPSLSYEWLASTISEGHPVDTMTVQLASTALAPQQRLELLLKMDRKAYHDEWFDCLLGDQLSLYAQWLQAADDSVRLRPLNRRVGERWKKMALMALDAGVTSTELASHCTPNFHSMIGPFSECYRSHIPAYEALCADPDERLHAAGREGLQWVRWNEERELASERRAEIYGR